MKKEDTKGRNLNRRSAEKYPALNKKFNLKTRSDIIDYDYVDKLPEIWIDPITGKKYNPKQFLNDFTNEYINASFSKKKKERVHKQKKVRDPKNEHLVDIRTKLLKITKEINDLINNSLITVKTKNGLRKTVGKFKKSYKKVITNSMAEIKDYYKKESEDRNNARNACIYTRAKAQGKTKSIDNLPENYHTKVDVEDVLINKIDEDSSYDE